MQRWRFINDGSGWTWQRVNGEKGRAVSAEPHKSFGAALNDALHHGFRPRVHVWTVDDDRTHTIYKPGRQPRIRTK